MSKTILQIIVEAITNDAVKDLGKVDKALDGVNKSSKDTTGGVGGLTKSFGLLKTAAVAFAGSAVAMAILDFGKQTVQAASNMNETLSKTSVIFGDSADAIEEFADTAAVSLGQSKQQAMDAAATFAVFGKSAGLTGGELVDFSTTLTGISSDLASFSNTTPEEAITALGAALRGESEPIRRYGVLLDDATLRQRALKMGIIETTKDALTPQQRALAAYQEILAQTGDAQGDFARTSDGLANQQRILDAQMADLKTTMGAVYIPTVIQATRELNKLAAALNESAKFQTDVNRATELGLISADEMRGTLRPMQIDQEELTKRLKEYEDMLISLRGPEETRSRTTLPHAIEATDILTGATEDLAAAADLARIEEDKLSQAFSDLKDAVSGPIREELKKFTDAQADNREEARLLLEQIEKLKEQGYSEAGAKIGELRGKLGELDVAFDENATAHNEATKKIVFNLLTQRAAMEGLTSDELELLTTIGEKWELIDKETADATRSIDKSLTDLANGEALPLVVSHMDSILSDAMSLDGQTFSFDVIAKYSEDHTGTSRVGGEVGLEERAAGGPVRPGGTYLVGEDGPEILTMDSGGGGQVIPITNNYYTLNMTSNAPVSTLLRDFSIMSSAL